MKSLKKPPEEPTASDTLTEPQLYSVPGNPGMFYEEVLTNIPAHIAVFNTRGEYMYINSPAIKEAGTRDWLIGKTFEDYCCLQNEPITLAAQRRAVLEKAIATKQLQKAEERYETPDGQTRHDLRHVYPVLDEAGNIRFCVTYSIEITEQKKAEEQIQLSEKKYRDLFNYSQAWICTHDMEGVLLSVNPAICLALDYTAAEMVGKPLNHFLPEEDRALFDEQYLQPFLRDGRSEGVFRVLSKSGQVVYLLYHNYKMDVPGLEPYVIGFSQDITSRIQTERELRHAKKLTDEAARAKEAFLANMSHEIRTPMNGVLGIAGLLAKTPLNEQQRKYLRLIEESANNLLLIVNDVLDLEKIIMGELQFEHVVFSLVDRVDMCMQSFIFKAEEKGIGLNYNNQLPNDIVVLGDPYRLSQVLNNLIGNAMKFTHDGTVTIETREVGRTENEVQVLFLVKDSGIGIPASQLEMIFEPFMQAHAAVTRTYGGTGLGLSISRELVQMMGGTLQVESEVNKGSVFSFIIPFAISSTKLNHPTVSQEFNYQSLGRRHVLVAEDVELNQYLVRHILESWGFTVDIVSNGLDAVAMVQQNRYDLVLMDIQMPEMDGIEATLQIRQLHDPGKASVPIIALTANVLKGDSDKYLAAGMNDYLAKPLSEQKLFQIISNNLKSAAVPAAEPVMNSKATSFPASQEKLYDLTMVETLSGGDTSFIKRMVQLFIDTMPPSLQELRAATEQQQWEPVSKLAHKMKATIDSMGIVKLKEVIRTIEMNGKKLEHVDAIPKMVAQVDAVVNQCIVQLKNDFDL